MRDRKAALSVCWMSVLGLMLGAASAHAVCRACDPFLHCVDQMPGARVCVESPGVCSMLVPCILSGGGRVADGSEEGLLTLTLFDAERSGTPSAVETDAGPLAVGRDAGDARGMRAHESGALAAAMLVHGRDYALGFADGAGGGFAVRRSEAGGAVHVEVLDMTGGAPGRVLATALLLAQDRLRVGVQVAGRERVLIVQASVVARGGLAAEQARLRHALREAGREIPETTRPLLEPRPL